MRRTQGIAFSIAAALLTGATPLAAQWDVSPSQPPAITTDRLFADDGAARGGRIAGETTGVASDIERLRNEGPIHVEQPAPTARNATCDFDDTASASHSGS
jgi:hypothetical protein